jgi:arsenate reductase (thioredoxin)
MAHGTTRSLRVLFLCTANSARSQIAEALLTRKGKGRFVVASAGSEPAGEVNPLAVRVLREYGIDWSGKRPKGFDVVQGDHWTLVITVCDRAKETCPTFPGHPVFAHWGIPDPADVIGPEEQRLRAFRETLQYLSRRIDLMLAIPLEKLERQALEERMRALRSPFEFEPTEFES